MKNEPTGDIRCRLCLKNSDGMENLFTFNSKYKFIVEDFAGLEIKNDSRLPSTICKICIEVINVLLEFRIMCKRSQKILECMIENKKTELTPELNIKVENEDSLKEPEGISENTVEKVAELENTEESPVHDEPKEEKSSKKQENTKQAPCDICGKILNKNRMKYHINRHLNLRPFECKENGCNKAFSSPLELMQHVKFGHNDYAPYKCNFCERQFKARYKLRLHESGHFEPQIPCEVCGKMFKNNRTLKRHMFYHTDDECKYKCSECSKRFQVESSLKSHLIVHTKKKAYSCQICEKSFKHKSSLSNHLRKVHKKRRVSQKSKTISTDTNKINDKVPSVPISNIEVKHEEDSLQITIPNSKEDVPLSNIKTEKLGFEESQHDSLEMETSEDDEEDIVSPILDIKVEDEVLLEKPQKDLEKETDLEQARTEEEKGFESDYCDVAEDESCYICGKMMEKHLIEYHINSHLGRRPFECKKADCNKAFTSPKQLRQHILYCHNDNPPHKCEFCERRFAFQYLLKLHKTTHFEPHIPCNVCGKLLRNARSLRRHMLNHTDERPFKCDKCSKTFKKQWVLTMHAKIHTTEKPYKCEICEASFTFNSCLKRHLRIHRAQDENNHNQESTDVQDVGS